MNLKSVIGLVFLSAVSLIATPAQAAKQSSWANATVIQGKATQYTESTYSPQPILKIRGKYLKAQAFYLVNIQLKFSAPYLWKPIECALVNVSDVANPSFSASLLVSQYSFYQGYSENDKNVPPITENIKQLVGIVRGSGTDLSVVCRPIVFFERSPGRSTASVIAKAEIIPIGKVTYVNE